MSEHERIPLRTPGADASVPGSGARLGVEPTSAAVHRLCEESRAFTEKAEGIIDKIDGFMEATEATRATMEAERKAMADGLQGIEKTLSQVHEVLCDLRKHTIRLGAKQIDVEGALEPLPEILRGIRDEMAKEREARENGTISCEPREWCEKTHKRSWLPLIGRFGPR